MIRACKKSFELDRGDFSRFNRKIVNYSSTTRVAKVKARLLYRYHTSKSSSYIFYTKGCSIEEEKVSRFSIVGGYFSCTSWYGFVISFTFYQKLASCLRIYDEMLYDAEFHGLSFPMNHVLVPRADISKDRRFIAPNESSKCLLRYIFLDNKRKLCIALLLVFNVVPISTFLRIKPEELT